MSTREARFFNHLSWLRIKLAGVLHRLVNMLLLTFILAHLFSHFYSHSRYKTSHKEVCFKVRETLHREARFFGL